jgi:putative transposase
MGRQPRLVADGLVYHALNRGNNRAPVFFESCDYLAFLESLRQTKERFPFRLFAYCLMTNHYHLVLQPEAGQNISRILQSLTVAHTWHYHRRCRTSGHVWQGRFKSPVIQDDEHLLTVLRYVESNPLRARMVSDLAAYPWSSYVCHGLGKSIAWVDETPAWTQLGRTDQHRQRHWRKWLHTPLSEKELSAVRRSVTTGRPYGSVRWVEGIANRLGIDLTSRPRGRPRKRQTAEK